MKRSCLCRDCLSGVFLLDNDGTEHSAYEEPDQNEDH